MENALECCDFMTLFEAAYKRIRIARYKNIPLTLIYIELSRNLVLYVFCFMRIKLIPIFVLVLFVFANTGWAQRSDVTISFSEQFFDAILDAVFQNGGALEFPLASSFDNQREMTDIAFAGDESFFVKSFVPSPLACTEKLRLLREINGVRTSVRFRDGRIYSPLAFSGGYRPPFVGCVEFAGWAETNIDLEFDQSAQRLVARVRVLNVNLNGTGGIGGAVIARMLQSSIDKKVNPIEIFKLEKVSFMVPVQNSTVVRMKAISVRHEISNGVMNIHITYDFLKG